MAEQERSIFFAPEQRIVLPEPPEAGWVLDIGGGGEGTIGQWIGCGIVAIDPNQRELEEAPPGPLKMVMDGSATPFLDESFDLLTMFFVMMYVPPGKREKIWREAWRVLKPGGRALIWGLTIPPHDGIHDLYAVNLAISHPGGEIETGYGTRWRGYQQDVDSHRRLARNAGFSMRRDETNGVVFQFEAVKGGSA
jgi:ubiquinone/menaquinone biosynthesis C-methylase UbiE